MIDRYNPCSTFLDQVYQLPHTMMQDTEELHNMWYATIVLHVVSDNTLKGLKVIL